MSLVDFRYRFLFFFYSSETILDFVLKFQEYCELYGKLILLPNPTRPAIVGKKINFHIFHRKTRKVEGFDSSIILVSARGILGVSYTAPYGNTNHRYVNHTKIKMETPKLINLHQIFHLIFL